MYQALEKATIDAAEWVSRYDDQKLCFAKVAPNYYYPGWWEDGPQIDVFINQKAFDALPTEYNSMVEAKASHAHVDMQARYDARNPIALKELGAKGTKLHAFSDEIMNASYKASNEIYSELSAKNANWKKSTKTWSSSAQTRTRGSDSPRHDLTDSCRRRNCRGKNEEGHTRPSSRKEGTKLSSI